MRNTVIWIQLSLIDVYLQNLKQGMEFYKERRHSHKAPDQWFLIWNKLNQVIENDRQGGTKLGMKQTHHLCNQSAGNAALFVLYWDGGWQSVAILQLLLKPGKVKLINMNYQYFAPLQDKQTAWAHPWEKCAKFCPLAEILGGELR